MLHREIPAFSCRVLFATFNEPEVLAAWRQGIAAGSLSGQRQQHDARHQNGAAGQAPGAGAFAQENHSHQRAHHH